LDLARHFPQSKGVRFRAASSDNSVATTVVSGAFLRIIGVRKGSASVTVTAIPAEGLGNHEHIPVTVPNRPPVVVGGEKTLELDLETMSGLETSLDVSGLFEDPDGDPLTYSAETIDPTVAVASVEGTVVSLVGGATGGETVLRVTADDGDRGRTSVEMRAIVTRTGHPIHLVYPKPVDPRYRSAFAAAAVRWSMILRSTDLPEVVIPAGTDVCSGHAPPLETEWEGKGTLVYVYVTDNLFPGALAAAAVCAVRADVVMPVAGMMFFGRDATARLYEEDGATGVSAVATHELAHVLGIGSMWRDMIEGEASGDPHFPGPRATAAFDDAGGRDYTGRKVPVQFQIHGHWRRAVFPGEIMNPFYQGAGSALSAITLGALVDLGYTVDIDAADPYRLPAGEEIRPGSPLIDLTGDVLLDVPVVVVGR
jgi:hypothetical protein